MTKHDDVVRLRPMTDFATAQAAGQALMARKIRNKKEQETTEITEKVFLCSLRCLLFFHVNNRHRRN